MMPPLLGIKVLRARFVERLSSAGGDVSSMVGVGAGFGLGGFLTLFPLLGMTRRATQGEQRERRVDVASD